MQPPPPAPGPPQAPLVIIIALLNLPAPPAPPPPPPKNNKLGSQIAPPCPEDASLAHGLALSLLEYQRVVPPRPPDPK
ncbi:hypothetical protein CMK18_24070 [Candidatus Poribacteria bacterium]|nr:hypothetical protein [Candidatus Poribacteria bacterium]